MMMNINPSDLMGTLNSSTQMFGLGSSNKAFDAQYKSVITKTPADVAREKHMSIDAITQENAIAAGTGVGGMAGSFAGTLKSELNRVNELQNSASTDMQDYATGGDIALHQVMMSINKAELSLQLATQVRNKMVSAYQDISRMQI
jgi:flagellar hook-basal body complex protein FliE